MTTYKYPTTLSQDEEAIALMTPYKLISGKYIGYEVLWTKQGQIFPREGFYLCKSEEDGTVKDILYLEEALPKL